MRKILLVCSAGMSTSILVKNMKNEAANRGIEVWIEAHSITEVEEYVGKVDVCLLGPQVRYSKNDIAKTLSPVPVESIDMSSYGRMDGKGVLDQALNLIASK